MLKMTRCSIFMYDFFYMISHAKNISIFTQIERNFVAFYPKMVGVQLMEFIHLQCSSTLKMTRFQCFAHVYIP